VAGFHCRECTRQSGLNDGKLNREIQPHQPPIRCPQCRSLRVWKDGFRHLAGRKIQRYLCRDCAFRFSESTQTHVKLNIHGQILEMSKPREDDVQASILKGSPPVNDAPDESSLLLSEDICSHAASSNGSTIESLKDFRLHTINRRVCVPEGGMINLAEVKPQQEEAVAGAKQKPDAAMLKGKVLQYSLWLNKQGFKESVILSRTAIIKQLLKLGADMWNPESIKELIARQKTWNDGYKRNVVYAYSSFLEMEGLTWKPPRYRQPESIPFIPTEAELDQLIASCGSQVGTFLQGLKDTGADPGELGAIRWIDIDRETRTITINRPVKGHNPRVLRISQEFIDRVERLPKRSERVFKYLSIKANYYDQRRRTAFKLGNPRLLKISLIAFRHWKGTMEYHRTRDILYVKKLLGHKCIQNTLIYIDLETALFHSTNDEFTVRVASNAKEACSLVESGFEYVTGEYGDGGKIFRKRK